MKRREFITLLGGAAVAWPLVTRAQQPGQIRRIGLLMIIPEGDSQSRADRDALGSGLHELGWISGRNVDLEYCWSDGDEPLLRKYAAELVGTSPDVLMTEGTAERRGRVAARGARAAGCNAGDGLSQCRFA